MVLEVKSKTLMVQDLDLDATYQGEATTNLFNRDHSYRVIQKSLDAYHQKCSLCDRERQAKKRVTMVNQTLGVTFYAGFVCLEDFFGITEEQLTKNTFLLTSLARSWELYRVKTGNETFFESTRDAVADMRHHFEILAQHKVFFVQPAVALERILNDLAHINDFKADVFALEAIIGIMYESVYAKQTLNDRIETIYHHPLFGPHAQANAAKVLHLSNVTWLQVKNFTEQLRTEAGKKIPIRIKQVAIYDSPNYGHYVDALSNHAHERLGQIDQRHDQRHPSHSFVDVMRKKIQNLGRGPGFYEMVFDASTPGPLERIRLSDSLKKMIDNMGAVFIRPLAKVAYRGSK